jgi:AcrR family transcriptional regulator
MTDPTPPPNLPAPLDLLWGQRTLERERRRGLSAERVVGAAIELADVGGIGAVSMGRVAKHLGFTPMALYRYVRSKEELVALMVDEAVGSPSPFESTSGSGWRAGLERWAWELLAVARAHPWILDLPLPSLPFGPNRLLWFDRGLQTFAETSLAEDDKAALILLVNNYVFSQARLAVDASDGPEGVGTAAAAAFRQALSALADAERFPAVRASLDAGLLTAPRSRDANFAFGLERILDGIEQLVARS